MRWTILAVVLLSLVAPGEAQKKPDVEVLLAKAHRAEGKILVDVKVRAVGVKPLRGLVVIFDLLSPENGVLASETAVLDQASVEPGEERSAESQTSESARAVRFLIRVFDGVDRQLRVQNGGPFPIE